MTEYQIVEAKAYHVGQLVRGLRLEHLENLRIAGLDPHRVFRTAFLESSFCRSGFIQGKLAAMWGVTGTGAASTGVVWVGFTDWATKFRRILVTETRRQLDAMMETRHDLNSGVIVGDAAAWRFASRMGFFLKHPNGADTLSPQTGSLECILSAAPDYRLNLRPGASGVLVGYQGAPHG